MDIILLFTFAVSFLMGASVGSFTNVLIDRLPRHQSIIRKRSFCESCKKSLTILELVPIISYITLGGRCKNCKNKIPPRLFMVELLVGLSYALLFLFYFGGGIDVVNSVYLALILPIFVGIFFSDLEYGVIPDELVIALIGIIFAFLILYAPYLVTSHLLSGFALSFFFLLIFLFTSGRGMGFGDVKLSFAQGLFLGFPLALVSMYLAFLTGGVVSLILIAWGKKKLKGDTVPFGPFLIFSTVVSYLVGDKIINAVSLLLA